MGGRGGIIYLSLSHYISFSANIGPTINNSIEFFALKQLIQLEKEQEITYLHIYGDSLPVINWMKDRVRLRNYTLLPLYQHILILITYFTNISFDHV